VVTAAIGQFAVATLGSGNRLGRGVIYDPTNGIDSPGDIARVHSALTPFPTPLPTATTSGPNATGVWEEYL